MSDRKLKIRNSDFMKEQPAISKLLSAKQALQLKNWFQSTKRAFPWREDPSPYAVWVSEVMLQQTQASVVIPYFEKWMKKYPTIEKLAQAEMDDVLKTWEGLGYYARARHLHAGAQYVVAHYKGVLPSQPEELSQIKGLGPYTTGAIRSFAFKQKASAVDGNVLRVLSRYFLIEDDTSKPKTWTKVREIADAILPEEEPWVFSEALIELGATICTKQPKCYTCPLSSGCQAYANGMEQTLPYKSAKMIGETLNRMVFVISCGDALLIRRGKPGEIMSDLHEFPYFEIGQKKPKPEALSSFIQKQWNFNVQLVQSLSPVSHSFTKYQVHLTPFLFKAKSSPSIDSMQWMGIQELKQKAFSSGHRRIFQSLIQQEMVL